MSGFEFSEWNGPLPTVIDIAKMIDHSLLRPELTTAEVLSGLELAVAYNTASVCVRPADVKLATRALFGSDVLVGTVVGFPHGNSTPDTKSLETLEALRAGAQEIDMVVNIGRLKDGDFEYIEGEIRAVLDAAGSAPVKVIFENTYLDTNQKVGGYLAAQRAGAAFIKTSTGFAPGGATPEDIKLMRETVNVSVGVKAAGGVRSLDALLALRSLGATRFGATATASILDDLRDRMNGSAPAASNHDSLY